MVNFGLPSIFRLETDPDKRKELLELVDRSLFDVMWTGDLPHFNDPYIDLTRMATLTKRIKLGLACTNPYTRNPYITASAVHRINELANGRLILAIGAGSIDVLTSLGMGWTKPVQACRETIEIVRALSSGEVFSYDGGFFRLKSVKPLRVDSPKRIPIYVACRRPHMLMMAGAIADGVILDAVPVEYIKYAMSKIKDGASATGRSLNGFKFANLIPFAFSEDREWARNLVKYRIAIDQITVSKKVLDLVGIDPKELKPMMKAHPNLNKASRLVTDKMVEKFSITGTLDECIKKIDVFIKNGINELALAFPVGSNIKEMVKTFDEQVIPKYKDK